MIIMIARHIFRESRASRLFSFYVMGLILLFSISSGIYLHRFAEARHALTDYSQDLRRRATLERTFTILPPNQTGFLSSSDDAILPSWLEIRPYEPVDMGGRLEPNSFLIGNETLDWRVIIGIWGSLAALLISCDSVANRVNGRLIRLLWSQPISRGQYFWGRTLGQLAVIMAPLVIIGTAALIANLVALSIGGYSYDLVDIAGKSVLVFLAAPFYLLIFIQVGWIMSIIWDSESKAILGGLTIWTVAVWIWPILGMILGQVVKPLEPYRAAEMSWQEVEWAALGSLSSRDLTKIVKAPTGEEQKRQEILKLEKKFEEDGQVRYDRAKETARGMRADYNLARRRQTENTLRLAAVSPFGLWNQIVNTLAEAGYDRYIQFIKQSSDFARDFGKYSDDLKAQNIGQATYKSNGQVTYSGYALHQRVGRLFDHIPLPQGKGPLFRWQSQTVPELMYAFSRSLAVLVGLVVVLLSINMYALRRISLE